MKDKIYFRNVANRWRKEAEKSQKELIILSPYVTAPTAISVLERAHNAYLCELYTQFSLMNFVNGGSSLSALKLLLVAGVRLYHLPDIHAKVVLVDDRFASIGSQNLTARGTRQLEATICFDGEEDVRSVAKNVKRYTSKRVAITMSMLVDAEEFVAVVEKEYRKVASASDAFGVELWRRHKEREEEEMLARKVAAEVEARKITADLRRRDLSERLDGCEVSTKKMRCTIKYLQRRCCKYDDASYWYKTTYPNECFDDYTMTSSLVPPANTSLLTWRIERDKVVKLEKTKRYLCINKTTGHVGWVRLFKTRISFVGYGIDFVEMHDFGPWRCRVSVSSIRDPEAPHVNIKIDFVSNRPSVFSVSVNAWFSLDQVYFEWGEQRNDMTNWMIHEEDYMKKSIVSLLTRSFVYKKKLHGAGADTFFGISGSHHDVCVVLLESNPVLVSKCVD